jgi:general secretion pathway protein L
MTAAAFFDWWRTQLSELVPAPLHGSWHNAKITLALRLEQGSLKLSAPPAQAATTVELNPGDQGSEPKQVVDFLDNLPGRPQRIRLTLGPAEYLLQHLTLPRAAQPHLAEAVGYQLPQVTPFTADQLFYACGETPDSPVSGPLSVWLVAVPSQRITEALRLVGQPPPENPLPIKVPPGPGEQLVVSWSVREQAESRRRRMRIAWAALLALWLAVLGLHTHNRQQAQSKLDLARDELRARAVEVGRLRDRLEHARSQATWLVRRREQAISPLMLLDVLTQQLDDQTWLEGFELRGQRLTLRGISSSPAGLLETLETSRLLRDVKFEAAITRDGRGQGDRFSISARLEPASQDAGT